MKSFIRAITITIVLTLITAGSARTQVTSAPVQTTPSAAIQQLQQQMIKEANKRADDFRQNYFQLNIASKGQYGGGKVLVIPTAEIMPQDVGTMMEDMTVMCRIFDKKLAQSQPLRVRFSSNLGWTFFSQDSRSTGAIYVQGYGTLFLTKVDFLLSPPPEAPVEKETKEEDVDPVWEQMKQEMYTPEEDRRRRPDRPEEKYDAEKVENLKTTLIKALKHAANIRGLKSDESVILTVIGKASQSAGVTIQAIGGTDEILVEDKRNKIVSIVKAPSLSDIGFSSPTVLVISAKKSDIDAFAKGQYDFDQFRQRTQLLLYPFLGEIVGGPSRSYPTDMFYGGSSNRRIR